MIHTQRRVIYSHMSNIYIDERAIWAGGANIRKKNFYCVVVFDAIFLFLFFFVPVPVVRLYIRNVFSSSTLHIQPISGMFSIFSFFFLFFQYFVEFSRKWNESIPLHCEHSNHSTLFQLLIKSCIHTAFDILFSTDREREKNTLFLKPM